MPKSFYDYDYYIELNEKRQETLKSEFDKAMGRISNIVIIYSVFSVFLIAIWKDLLITNLSIKSFFGSVNGWYIFFAIAFLILFIISIYFTIRFVLPITAPAQEPPKVYYNETRLKLEPNYSNPQGGIDQNKVSDALKLAYLTELEEIIDWWIDLVDQKAAFYFYALRLSLAAFLPFIICLIFHTAKSDKPTQIEVVNSGKNSIFISDTVKIRNVNNRPDTSENGVHQFQK